MTLTFTKSPLLHPMPFASDTANISERIPDDFADSGGAWLAQQATGLANSDCPVFMLIHADDGVIWGRAASGALIYPEPSAWTPRLRSLTVQQCRLFGDLGELFFWREVEGVWRGRKLVDVPGAHYEFISERPYLVGDHVYDQTHDHSSSRLDTWPPGFTPIIEVATGIRQIVPCVVSGGQRARLTILHYLHEDEDGQSVIKCSRLKHVG